MQSKRWQKLMKRFFDIAVSLLILLLFFPLWIAVAILIKMTSAGPVFFLQDRPGLHKEIFKVYKFRTMRPGSEKMIKGQEVMKDDDRVTAVGKFLRRSKMDEIPQLLNVLKGEMSLVGPRPERVASLVDYTDEISKRLNMNPGMTGLAQVSGNIYLSLEERYKFDVYYIENFSLWLDCKIIMRTVGVILFGEDRYVNKCLVNIHQGAREIATSEEESISK
ncbi:sugar transferase [Bacillaceae bacterium SAS-127]|nr:sugar transferase [Bacillaceae bacterium SAS-127]